MQISEDKRRPEQKLDQTNFLCLNITFFENYFQRLTCSLQDSEIPIYILYVAHTSSLSQWDKYFFDMCPQIRLRWTQGWLRFGRMRDIGGSDRIRFTHLRLSLKKCIFLYIIYILCKTNFLWLTCNLKSLNSP